MSLEVFENARKDYRREWPGSWDIEEAVGIKLKKRWQFISYKEFSANRDAGKS